MDLTLYRAESGPSALQRFGAWFAEALNHAFGNPREEAAHQPPSVGMQPFTGHRRRRRARRFD